MRSFSFSILFLVLSASIQAAAPSDLGQGLTYLRIQSLVKSAQDLRAALLRPAPLVLDLRYTADEPAAADVLRELNSQPAKPRLYVLVSPATPTSVAGILTTTSTPLVTLGVKDSVPVAQVVVAQTPEADRAAYDAVESGTALVQLIAGKIEKERFDEAALVQEFKNGHHEAHPPAVPALLSSENKGGSQVEGSEAGPAKPADSPAVPTDRVLQRAVHLHRALLALKR